MNFATPGADLRRAVTACAIVGHARLAATPVDQLAMTLAFNIGHAALRAARRAVGGRASRAVQPWSQST